MYSFANIVSNISFTFKTGNNPSQQLTYSGEDSTPSSQMTARRLSSSAAFFLATYTRLMQMEAKSGHW
jgi:hypothetical protein